MIISFFAMVVETVIYFFNMYSIKMKWVYFVLMEMIHAL